MIFDQKIFHNKRGLIVTALIVMAILGALIQYRGLLYDYFIKPPTFEKKELAGESTSEADKIFKSNFWQSLKFYGQLPIVPRETGRANPFIAAIGAANSPGTRDALRVSHVISLTSVLGLYFYDIGKYPIGETLEVGGEQARCLADAGWLDAETCEKAKNKYLDSAPRDPGSNKYIYTSDGNSYTLRADLETAKSLEYTVEAPKN